MSERVAMEGSTRVLALSDGNQSRRDQSARSDLVLFTDLDGTLLDAGTYRYDAARPALDQLRKRSIPVIISTSKTLAEVEPLRNELGNHDPFIIENGGVLYIPNGYFADAPSGASRRRGYHVLEWGTSYPEMRKALRLIERMAGVSLVGFGDMSVEDLMRVTGLTRADAERARQRECDEPFLINSHKSLQGVCEAARRLGLAVMPGGRFFHLVGGADKGLACRVLIDLYRKEWGVVSTAAIGDSLNDLPMLAVVDRPFLVERPEGGHAEGIEIEGLTRLPGIGSKGWNEGVNRLLRGSTSCATGSASAPYVDGPTSWYPGSLRDLV